MKTFNNDSPLYLQLRRHIEERILQGHLKEEENIPSLREMAKEYNLNPITVGNALSTLVEAGVLFKKRGVGIFVAPGAGKKIRDTQSKDFITEKLEPVIIKAWQLELPKKQITDIIDTIYGGTNDRIQL